MKPGYLFVQMVLESCGITLETCTKVHGRKDCGTER